MSSVTVCDKLGVKIWTLVVFDTVESNLPGNSEETIIYPCGSPTGGVESWKAGLWCFLKVWEKRQPALGSQVFPHVIH